MKTVYEVTVVDQSDFDAVMYSGLFADEELARKTMEDEVESYRADQDDEFKSSIVGSIVERELIE